MHSIILDTDFILHSVENKVDIFEEIKRIADFNYKIFILDKTLDELKGKKYEKMALNLIKNRVGIIETKKDKKVDDLLLELEIKNMVVCTTDKELKEKLKKRNIPVIHLRKKNHLVIENVL